MSVPGPALRALVHLGLLVLPAAQRRRWTQEHLAELHVLDRPARWRYAAGVLASAPALRCAVRPPGPSHSRAASGARERRPALRDLPVALTEAAPNAGGPAAGAPREPGRPAAPARLPLRCRLGYWHSWRVMATADGRRYVGCATCRRTPDQSWWGRNHMGR